jgi:hypothetical protein
VSHTFIPDLAFPRPNDWIRCASVLVYNAKIRSDRLEEAQVLKFIPAEHTYATFFTSLEHAYHLVGIHSNWSVDMTKEKFMERINNQTFGPEFMKEFVRIDFSGAFTIAERYELTKRTVTNIDMQFSHLDPARSSSQNISTLVIKRHVETTKASATSVAPTTPVSNNSHQGPRHANHGSSYGGQRRQRTMVIQGNSQQARKPYVRPTGAGKITEVETTSECPHCYKSHPYSPDNCHINKDVPISQVPEHARVRVLAARRLRYGPDHKTTKPNPTPSAK